MFHCSVILVFVGAESCVCNDFWSNWVVMSTLLSMGMLIGWNCLSVVGSKLIWTMGL